jgi:flagellar basal-body rod modification protein FlgD
MAIDSLGGVTSTGSALTNAGISQDEFLKILLTQLRFQDPLKPMDNEQFVAQLAQFSSLEISREQSDKIDSLVSMQATGQAVALIGKSVELTGSNAGQVGEVTAISLSTGQPLLTVKTSTTTLINVHLSDISLITDFATGASPITAP